MEEEEKPFLADLLLEEETVGEAEEPPQTQEEDHVDGVDFGLEEKEEWQEEEGEEEEVEEAFQGEEVWEEEAEAEQLDLQQEVPEEGDLQKVSWRRCCERN